MTVKKAGCFAFVCLLLALSAYSAEVASEAELRFQEAHQKLIKADEARDRKDFTAAGGLYQDALAEYRSLAANFPDTHPRVVNFRAAYCEEQLQAIVRNGGSSARANTAESAESVDTVLAEEMDVVQPENEKKADIARIKSATRKLLIQGETEKAYSLAMQGLRLEPGEPAMRLLAGTAQCQTGRFGEAISMLSKLAQENPTSAKVRVVLATAYFGQDEVQQAREHLEKAVALDPDMKEAHFNLAQVLLRINPRDRNAARTHYQQALSLGARPDETLTALLD